MPKLTVENLGDFDVPADKRLVLALEDEAKVDQLHACGGNARCTTCRVEFVSGEPDRMTAAEKNVLAAKGVTGVRLSCQILCDHDMTVRVISRLAGTGRAADDADGHVVVAEDLAAEAHAGDALGGQDVLLGGGHPVRLAADELDAAGGAAGIAAAG